MKLSDIFEKEIKVSSDNYEESFGKNFLGSESMDFEEGGKWVINELTPKIAVDFAKWLKHLDNGTTHYNPFTKEEKESIGFSPYDCFIDNLKTEEELFEEFLKHYNGYK